MTKKKLLVTGSCGFIGSNFVRKLVFDKSPFDVFSVDKVAQSSMLNNIYQSRIHEFYPADICDHHIMDRIFDYIRPDVIVHMAAEASVDKSIKEPTAFVDTNVGGTQILVNLALKYKVEKFFHISTDEVTGSLTPGESVWTEDAPLNPRNPYAATKAAAEMIVRAANITHGLPYIITRSCNNFGPRQTHDKLIPRVIKCILEDKPIPVYGKGEQIRDWIHVYDNCAAIIKLLVDGQINSTYNITANNEISNMEMIKMIIGIMGKGEIEFVADRPGHDFRYGMDGTKLQKLGWRPVYKLHDGLKNTIDWYQSNLWHLKQ